MSAVFFQISSTHVLFDGKLSGFWWPAVLSGIFVPNANNYWNLLIHLQVEINKAIFIGYSVVYLKSLILVTIKSTYGTISHCFWDRASYFSKMSIFLHPVSFNVFDHGGSSQIFRSLQMLIIKFFTRQRLKFCDRIACAFLTQQKITEVFQQDTGQTYIVAKTCC